MKRKMLKIEIAGGRTIASTEKWFCRCNMCLHIVSKGIIEVSTGTMIRKRMMKLKNLFPGKWSLQIAYAAKPLMMMLRTIAIKA